MKASIRFLLTLIIFAASVVSATAQYLTAQPKPAGPEAESPNAIEEQAYLLLEDVVASTQTLKLPQNRGRLQIIAGDLLWKRDQARARSLFSEAAANLVELEKQRGGSVDQVLDQPNHRLSCVMNSYLQQRGTTRLWPMSCFRRRDNGRPGRRMAVCRRMIRTWNNSCSLRP